MIAPARTLIVNGDDFGLTVGVNAGIVDAHVRGILTSTSLFANAGATQDAIALAGRHPALGVGCHLTLVDGVPVLPPDQLPTLTSGGVFRPAWRAFLSSVLAGRIDLDEVERELTAQIDRLRSAGLALTHLDGHKHVHAYPPVFEIVARLARRFAIPSVRIPCEAPALDLVMRFSTDSHARRQALENLALVPWSRTNRRTLERHRLPPAPAFLGRVLTGVFTLPRLQALMASVSNGVSELMMHPGFHDHDLDAVRTRLRRERATETALLTAPELFDSIQQAGIVLARHDGQLKGACHAT